MVTWCHNSTIWCHNSSMMATINRKYTWLPFCYCPLVDILFEVLRIVLVCHWYKKHVWCYSGDWVVDPQNTVLYDMCWVVCCPVATLQRHLWSNVSSKFHENRGILKPISRNRDMGVFFTWNFMKPPQKGVYFDTVFWAFLRYVSYQLFSMNLVLSNIQWC